MYSLDLKWPAFNVDLPSIEAWVKANQGSAGYVGCSADSDLSLWFTNDPTIVPMTTSTTAATKASASAAGQTIQAVAAGAAGNVQLTADGTTDLADLVSAWNAAQSVQLVFVGDGTQIPAAGQITLVNGADAVTSSSPSGPSPAAAIQAHWAALTSSSAEALAYTTNAQKAAVAKQVAAAQTFMNQLLVQFNTENLIMGIDQDNMVDEVLTVMSPVLVAMQSGSPTSAIKRAKAIPTGSYDSKYVTAARLLSYCNQIEAFLGLTLSTSLS